MENEVLNSISILKEGGSILYPTDTIWGLGCNPFSKDAVEKIRGIKNRPVSKSMILLVSSKEMLQKYVDVDDEIISLYAECPTTIVFKTSNNLPEFLLQEDGSIAIRLVNDPFCKALIDIFGFPLLSTSANKSGENSPLLFSEINTSILNEVDYVVNWRQDDTVTSKPSRIIEVRTDKSINILRD